MPIVFPQQFNSKPLLLIETTSERKGDYSIRCASHLVGRILRSDLSGGIESWLWTVTGPYLPESLRPNDAAPAAWRRLWRPLEANSMRGLPGLWNRTGQCPGMVVRAAYEGRREESVQTAFFFHCVQHSRVTADLRLQPRPRRSYADPRFA